MTEVKFYAAGDIPDGLLRFAVTAASFGGRWIFCRHGARLTWELPGGHREEGESIVDTAERELFEETGAVDFKLETLGVYGVSRDGEESYGLLCRAEVRTLDKLPPGSEMAEIRLFDGLPEPLTYPLIQPKLFELAAGKNTAEDEILARNRSGWDAIADSFFGVTALPVYGCLCPTEDELGLFPELSGKRVLDIGCGSGHSLRWCGDKGASELWGLDISPRQLENARRYLAGNGYSPRLFESPMELDPGLPRDYFDVAYSIYAVGWTVGLQKTFANAASYLKTGGVFIFSWDHPFMHCVDEEDGRLTFSGSYLESEPFTFKKTAGISADRSNRDHSGEDGVPLTLYNRRISDYVNALAGAGFAIERMIEESSISLSSKSASGKSAASAESGFTSGYYSERKANKFPLSFIIKARKL